MYRRANRGVDVAMVGRTSRSGSRVCSRRRLHSPHTPVGPPVNRRTLSPAPHVRPGFNLHPRCGYPQLMGWSAASARQSARYRGTKEAIHGATHNRH